ncbi:MAG: hypothetical protein HY035_10150 [Nitrospirae bacterium]|nr:hypothetical protein [Nitrospirota bacterium]
MTSGNLTSGGLLNNYEYGLLINDEELTAKIAEDYRKVFKDTEATGIITAEIISKAYNILQSVPKEKKPKFELKDKDLFKKVTEEDIEVDRYEGGIESIQNNLSGWVKDVFTVLNEIDSDVFRLNAVYKYEERLKTLHPRNTKIQEKSRQQLQKLRDLGLLQFVDRGVYRKLWK